MNCVVTINVGNYLSSNARSSFRAASRRWHADYVEVSYNQFPQLNPCYLKSPIMTRLQHYARIAFFDGDMLIRDDAPNVFGIFDDPLKIYAVKDISDNRLSTPAEMRYDIIAWVRAPYYEPARKLLGGRVDYESYVTRFINGGFFVCSPQLHSSLFGCLNSILHLIGKEFVKNGHFEQALLNYALQVHLSTSLV